MINTCFCSAARIFFTVNALASIGLNIGIVGVGWLIIDATGSNQLLGTYGALSLISAFVALALAGAVMDKYSKLALLRFCCVGQASIFFLTSLLSYLQVPVLWIVYGLAVLNMPLMVLFSVVSRGAVACIWDEALLTRGNSVLEITLQIGAIFAALLTGVLYQWFGFSLLIGLAGWLCLAAALLLIKWPIVIQTTEKRSAPFMAELRAGWNYLIRQKKALLYGFLAFIPTIIISVSNTVIPGYVEQSLGKQSITYGIGDMCFAVGALLAGWIGTRWERLQTRFLGVLFLVATMGLALLQIGRSVLLFYTMIFVVGISLAQLRILLNTLFMKKVDTSYLGRSLSLLMAMAMFLQAVLSYGIGRWMDWCGAASGFMGLWGLCLFGLLFLGIAGRLERVDS